MVYSSKNWANYYNKKDKISMYSKPKQINAFILVFICRLLVSLLGIVVLFSSALGECITNFLGKPQKLLHSGH